MSRHSRFARAMTTLLCLPLLGACASRTYTSFRSEQEIPHLAAKLQDAPALDLTLVTTRGPGGRDLDVAVWTEEEDRDRVIVLLHGVLADSRAWRYVSGDLDDLGDLVMIDLPGSGESQALPPFILKRDDPSGYSTPALAHRTTEAIDAAIDARTRDASKVTIVAHSLGALIALRLLADESIAPGRRDWIERVDQIVLISPVDPAMPYGPPSLEAVATVSWFDAEFGELTGVLKERVSQGATRTFVDPERVPREQVDALYETLSDNHKRRIAQDMLETVLPVIPVDEMYYPDWSVTEPFVEQVRAFGRREGMTFLLIVGERDEVIPASMAYRLASQLEDAHLVAIAETKHSPHLERPDITSRLVTSFLESGAPPNPPPRRTPTFTEQRITP